MEQKDHYCVDCKKSFGCGKALGGHRSSAHVQPAKDYSKKLKNSKLKNNNNNLDDDDDDDEDESVQIFPCCVCEKEFDSVKSLSGHMRCHPDRDWRGVEAPTQQQVIINNNPNHDHDSESNSNDDDVDDVSDIDDDDEGVISGGWGESGRRGRVGSSTHIPYSSSSSSMVDDDNGEVMNTACMLLCLSKSWIPSGKHPMVEYTSMYSHYLASNYSNTSTRHDDDDDDYDDMEEEDLFKESANAFLEIHTKGLEYPSNDEDETTKTKTLKKTNSNVMIGGENKKKGKKKMAVKEEEVDLVMSSPRKTFKCTQCPNVYTCHQALGGHMSTHPKLMIHDGSSEQKIHQCKICNQIFLSGQALGGHQRCHWNNGQNSTSSTTTRRKLLLNIDLNESPPNDSMEDN